MSKQTIKLKVEYEYTLTIDWENSVVKDYENAKELLVDIATRQFGSGTPVIASKGVVVDDCDFIDYEVEGGLAFSWG